MRAGDFARAREVSDEVLAARKGASADALPRHFQWVWKGEPLEGKRVLIRCYPGLGDTIQFIRYAPPLVQRDRAVRHSYRRTEICASDWSGNAAIGRRNEQLRSSCCCRWATSKG